MAGNEPELRVDSPSAKTLAVLATVARLRAASVSGLAGRLGMPVATAHRICGELERLGYLQRVPATRLWTVAHRLVDVATDALAAAARSLPVSAILRELTERVGEMSSFAVRSGDEVFYVASVESQHELTLSFRAGRKAPLFCTSIGRLILARLDDEEVLRYLELAPRPAYTKYTVTDPKKLLAIIQRVRREGHAVTCHEFILHVVGAAVPVVDGNGTFFGALSISAPDVRTGKARLLSFLPALRSAATRLAEVFSEPLSRKPVRRRSQARIAE